MCTTTFAFQRFIMTDWHVFVSEVSTMYGMWDTLYSDGQCRYARTREAQREASFGWATPSQLNSQNISILKIKQRQERICEVWNAFTISQTADTSLTYPILCVNLRDSAYCYCSCVSCWWAQPLPKKRTDTMDEVSYLSSRACIGLYLHHDV